MSRALRMVAGLCYGGIALAVTLAGLMVVAALALGRISTLRDALTMLALGPGLLLWGLVWGLSAVQRLWARAPAWPRLRWGAGVLVGLGLLSIVLGTLRPARARQDERLAGTVLLVGSLALLRRRAGGERQGATGTMAAA